MDKKDYKIQALLEKVSSLTTNYENQVADLRVELTFLKAENDELQKQAQGDVSEDSEEPADTD